MVQRGIAILGIDHILFAVFKGEVPSQVAKFVLLSKYLWDCLYVDQRGFIVVMERFVISKAISPEGHGEWRGLCCVKYNPNKHRGCSTHRPALTVRF